MAIWASLKTGRQMNNKVDLLHVNGKKKPSKGHTLSLLGALLLDNTQKVSWTQTLDFLAFR